MSTGYLARLFALVVLLSVGAPSASELVRQVTIPIEFVQGYSRDQWDHGYWIQYSAATRAGEHPMVWAYDRDGYNTIKKTEVWFPDAFEVVIHSVASAGDGSFIASAEVWKAPGVVATVLVRIKPPGVVTDIVRTDSFFARSMVLDATGQLWALGATAGGDPLERKDSLRRFSLEAGISPSVAPRVTGEVRAYEGRLVASHSRIGFLNWRKDRSWLEFNTTGDLIDSFFIINPPALTQRSPYRLVALAMTEDDRVYATLRAEADSSLFGLYQLDRVAHGWVAVPRSSLPVGFGGLFGTDHNQLILRKGCCVYGWISAPDVLRDRKVSLH